ncbi:hypothetical protein MUU74_10835 [Chryseobacterium daecheongense]|uniref:hypothetical protein n=1 Tax=Chryseobacterium daecheongense TaxID=192389 RepID=UPI001FD666C5|nr:hypothetical protein [Chryseobacterium daecheongense]UOU96989.1 hypothetical protein MUU74_10835 [Chryseobacterium daecheongense]
MKEYYCLDLKFKNQKISAFIHHAHLYIKDEEIFIRIFENKEATDVYEKFCLSDNSLGLFEENFNVIESDNKISSDKSRIWKAERSGFKDSNSFFTVYLTSICIVKKNEYKENINQGKVYLNNNGLKITNNFYSFFTNFKDKNIFEIGRMDSMKDFYNCDGLKFRPELEFWGNDRRDSEEFTIKKIPIINYSFENESYESAKEKIDIICKFLSFCFGIRVNYINLHYRTVDNIYYFSNYETLDHTYNSKFSPIFRFLKENCRIEKILCTDWFNHYIQKGKKLDKAIENYLHSREVDGNSKFLLLFNIIEIFNVKQEVEKFDLNELKEENFKKALELIEETLVDKDEVNLLRDKWKWSINKLVLKPIKSPLEETLKHNGIEAEKFGFSFKSLKDIRDKLTHGSVGSIKEQKLKDCTDAMGKISISLILAQLGFMEDTKKVFD